MPCHALVDMNSHRRVVAVGLNPAFASVQQVMTPNPITVRVDDSAMEALGIMMGRHFRHLPVSVQWPRDKKLISHVSCVIG